MDIRPGEELKLWNDLIFVEVRKHRQLVCRQCGSRNVKVMPIFPLRHEACRSETTHSPMRLGESLP